MPRYEVRVDGGSIGTFDEPEEALECVRAALEADPDHEPEIIDMETGKAFEPAAASADGDDADGDELASKIG